MANRAIELVEEHFEVEWRETGKEWGGSPTPELFVDGKATGFTRYGLQELHDDLCFASDPACMGLFLRMEAMDFDPEKEFLAHVKAAAERTETG